MTIKLGTEDLRIIAIFEKITRVQPRDCLIKDDCIYFLISSDKVGLTIGKNGSIIKEVKRLLGKPVKILSYFDNPEDMIRNLVPNVKKIDMNNGSMIITVPPKDKLSVIGRNGNNIKTMREIFKRHFEIENLKLR